MKPIVIIALAVACSVGAVFGVSYTLDLITINQIDQEVEKKIEEQQKYDGYTNSEYYNTEEGKFIDQEIKKCFDTYNGGTQGSYLYDCLRNIYRFNDISNHGVESIESLIQHEVDFWEDMEDGLNP